MADVFRGWFARALFLLRAALVVAAWVGPATAQTPSRYLPETDPWSANGLYEGGAIYRHPAPRARWISARKFGLCLAQTVLEVTPNFSFSMDRMIEKSFPHFPKDTPTEPHEGGFNPPFVAYLQADPARPVDFQSGTEGELAEWVLDNDKPENSIDPLRIFRKSLELNHGNVWNTLLAIHDLLRNEARWFDRTRYVFRSSREKEEAFFNKLIDIRGDLRERGEIGDHFGSWYRPWLGMLLRLYFGRLTGANETSSNSLLRKLLDLWTSVGISRITEAWTFSEVGEKRDPDNNRKAELTFIGIRSADWLISGLRDPSLLNRYGITRNACDSRTYLRELK
jgi:hypothetical protein